ncbi:MULTISPECIES: flavin reductase family protein [Bradyrhizobium]|uniref:Flavin reductase family protein n=1 Tax=Bradyrhizobium uaiense TaxID=2594946 RepID=A0A6P1B871_9BRAD|nr:MULTISPECIES: flavin reductase family protein [Bradyrhizobium]NEU94726.1 flavin reductase family protein [Bradyrhizobium uaiense]QOZ36948.1 flavin reductase [Bradyrhizobium sp. CCBAU 53421]
MSEQMDSRMLRDAFGAFPTGVVAVAAQVDGKLMGLAASSFTSVSLDPPLVSFSVAKGSTTWPDLRRAEHLGVTVLAEDHGALCRQLAGPAPERFTGVAFEITDSGAVMLAEGIAQYDCSVRDEFEAGDHIIVLLKLHAVVVHSRRQPLIFHRSEFGRLA